MDDIDELSRRLFENEFFIEGLKERLDRFTKEKTEVVDNQPYLRPLQESFSLQFKENSIDENEQIHFSSERLSVTSSAFQKRQSRDSVSSMASNPLFQHYIQSYSQQGPSINTLTTQITNILAEMIKKQTNLLGNSRVSHTLAVTPQSISQLIQNMQSIQKQQLTMVKQSLEEKVESLKLQMQRQVTSVIQRMKIQRKAKKMAEKSSLVKKHRKLVTQSILDISKNNHQMSTFSNIYDVGNILSDSEPEQESSLRKNSPQISILESKLSEVQKSQTRISREFEEKFLREVEQNKKDIQAMTERIIEWKLKNEERLEEGFSGVWNVVTDIEDKMNRVTLRVVELEHAFNAG